MTPLPADAISDPGPTIWIMGEALIDFVPRQIDGAIAYVPQSGGSPYNAAKAAALAGARVRFVGGISTDFFGDMLVADLERHGVDTGHALRSAAPTTLAFVTFAGNHPRYAFFNNLTSTSLVQPPPLAGALGLGDVVSVGSISLIDRPGAENITAEALRCARDVLLAFDPNVRADMVRDRPDWTGRMERLLAAAGLIKLSVEDLAVLRPDMTGAAFAAAQLAAGTGLVVITDGEKGARAFGHAGAVSVASPQVRVRDTVGAGDTLMGTLLAELALRRATRLEDLKALPVDALRQYLHRSVIAAALNCTVTGCNPPTRAAVDAWLAKG